MTYFVAGVAGGMTKYIIGLTGGSNDITGGTGNVEDIK